MALRRHKFSMKHYVFTGGRIGQLIPVLRHEVIPGDTWSGTASLLCRLKSMANPVLHPAYFDTYYFYVPNRILWEHWEDFITDAGSANAAVPTVKLTDAQSSFFLYGKASGGAKATDTFDFNAFYLYAYNMIWNEFFRDADVDTAVALTSTGILAARAMKQIYTKARPKVEQVDVTYQGKVASGTATLQAADTRDALRKLRLAERRAMFGDRYFDVLRSWGIRTNYQWLDRPEYLGRSRNMVSFSDIPATGPGTNVTVGDLYGHGIVGLHHRMRRKVFPEHGYLVGLALLRFVPLFTNASPWDAFKSSQDDYWAPEYEMQSPVSLTSSHVANSKDKTHLGYLPKFEEYRQHPNLMGSQLDLTYFNPLTDPSSLATTFDSQTVNDDKIFNDTSKTNPHFQMHCHNKFSAIRMVSRVRTA